MKTSVSFYQFCDAFQDAGRQDQFSYDAKRALFDYIEQYEADCGTEYELDPTALCHEYEEADVIDIIKQYAIEIEENSDEDEVKEQVIEWLQDNTQYVGEGKDNMLVYYSCF